MIKYLLLFFTISVSAYSEHMYFSTNSSPLQSRLAEYERRLMAEFNRLETVVADVNVAYEVRVAARAELARIGGLLISTVAKAG